MPRTTCIAWPHRARGPDGKRDHAGGVERPEGARGHRAADGSGRAVGRDATVRGNPRGRPVARAASVASPTGAAATGRGGAPPPRQEAPRSKPEASGAQPPRPSRRKRAPNSARSATGPHSARSATGPRERPNRMRRSSASAIISRPSSCGPPPPRIASSGRGFLAETRPASGRRLRASHGGLKRELPQRTASSGSSRAASGMSQ